MSKRKLQQTDVEEYITWNQILQVLHESKLPNEWWHRASQVILLQVPETTQESSNKLAKHTRYDYY